MADRARVAVLISGRGSNMRSLIGQAAAYEIVAVMSNREAPGLEFAREAGITTAAFMRTAYSTRIEQQRAIFAALGGYEPDFIALKPATPGSQAILLTARQAGTIFYSVVLAYPLAVLAAGLGVWTRRRRR